MITQATEPVELGDIKVSRSPLAVFVAAHVATGVIVTVYDQMNKVGGIAHVVMPESTLTVNLEEEAPGKYANLAVPALIEAFVAEGGQLATTIVKTTGGSQLFNFGGGGGNVLNIGARNASAIMTAMTKHGLAIVKADIGGNKARNIKFSIAHGELVVQQIGGATYPV